MNPVVETFADLFKPLERTEEAKPAPKITPELFTLETLNRAVNLAFGIKKTTFTSLDGVILHEAGMIEWIDDLPKTQRRKVKK